MKWPKDRKSVPLASGALDYFPDALVEVARCSHVATDQHHSGEPLHWDRTKSLDHADSLMRHLVDRGKLDSDGVRHTAKVAWRALALLQTELELAAIAQAALEKHVAEVANRFPEACPDLDQEYPPDFDPWNAG